MPGNTAPSITCLPTNKACQLVDLLAMSDLVEEHGCHACAASCAGTCDTNTAPVCQPTVASRCLNWEARCLILAGGVAVPTVREPVRRYHDGSVVIPTQTPIPSLKHLCVPGPADRHRGQRNIMIEELTPLHQETCELDIWFNILRTENLCGHQPGAWLQEAVIELSCVPA